MIKPYFSGRDTLLHVYDIILKGDRIFILKSLRTKVLEQWHLGNDSLLRRARDTIFWMQLAQNCSVCLQTKRCNTPELLLLHDEGCFPFAKVGVNCSILNLNVNFITKYHSKTRSYHVKTSFCSLWHSKMHCV